MEEAAAVRRAALTAIEDVEPGPLRERIEDRLREASLTPGVLAVECARAVAGAAPDAVADRAAGVQLVYEGLRLTRTLARDPPWEDESRTDQPQADGGTDAEAAGDAEGATDAAASVTGAGPVADAADHPTRESANLDVLVADVLVARGFYLLARTDAAAAAVGVVRSFGGDQTRRRTTGDDSFDRNLEADVLDLAAVAGATVAEDRDAAGLRAVAADLAADGLPSTERVASEDVRDRLAAPDAADSAAGDGYRPSADG